MLDYLYDAASLDDPGQRQVMEDRARVERIATAGGLDLQIALVCDGTGGQYVGDVAAERGGNAVIRFMQESQETEILTLIQAAVAHANNVVLREAGGGKTTLAMIVILNDGSGKYGRMYIASLGNSRIGLVREGKLRWLNHSYDPTEDLMRAGVSPQDVYGRDSGEYLTDTLGAKRQIEADIGFYHNTTGTAEAQRRGENGIRLEEGDVVFACSDGLAGINPEDSQPYLRDDEIAIYAMKRGARDAAQILLDFGRSRQPLDNLSLALIQVDPNSPKFHAAVGQPTPRRWTAVTGAVAVVVLALAVFFILSSRGNQQQSTETGSADQSQTQVAMNALQMSQTVAAFTPTATDTAIPTSTPRPPPMAGVVGAWFQLSKPNPPRNIIQEGDQLDSNAIRIKADLNQADPSSQETANIYMFENSSVVVDRVSNAGRDGIGLTFKNGDMFTDNGDYTTEIQIQVAKSPSLDLYVAQQGCLSVADAPQNPDLLLQVACFRGTCNYSTSVGGGRTLIPVGQWVLIDTRQLISVGQSPLAGSPLPDHYRQLLYGADLYSRDYNECVGSYEPTPTPTSTPTLTPTVRPTPILAQPVNP